jgi:hypothetical protein
LSRRHFQGEALEITRHDRLTIVPGEALDLLEKNVDTLTIFGRGPVGFLTCHNGDPPLAGPPSCRLGSCVPGNPESNTVKPTRDRLSSPD